MARRQSDLATDFWAPRTGIPQSGLPALTRQPEQSSYWQSFCDQLFTWPTDQPRHATQTCGNPVESDRPRFVCSGLTCARPGGLRPSGIQREMRRLPENCSPNTTVRGPRCSGNVSAVSVPVSGTALRPSPSERFPQTLPGVIRGDFLRLRIE